MIKIVRTNSADPGFRELVALLDKDLAIRDGDEHAFYAQYNGIDSIANTVVAYEGSRAVGCGAFKPYEAGAVEIKRMYVREDCRGKGIAHQVLNELEKWAAEMAYKTAVLETGKKQPEAIRLYEKSGYHRIANYGQYAAVENSVCMQKQFS